MEAQHPRPAQDVMPLKPQEWPAVPSTPIPSSAERDSPTAMEVDSTPNAEDRSRRATSVLSMDDIEAAQALEGLRAGGLIARIGRK